MGLFDILQSLEIRRGLNFTFDRFLTSTPFNLWDSSSLMLPPLNYQMFKIVFIVVSLVWKEAVVVDVYELERISHYDVWLKGLNES